MSTTTLVLISISSHQHASEHQRTQEDEDDLQKARNELPDQTQRTPNREDRPSRLTCALRTVDESLINRLSSSALAPKIAAPLLERLA